MPDCDAVFNGEGNMVFPKQSNRVKSVCCGMGVFLLLTVAGLNSGEGAQPQQKQVQTLPDFVALSEKLAPIVVNISATQSARRPQGTPPAQPSPDPFGGTDPFQGNDPFSEYWRRFFGERFGGPEGQAPRAALGSGFIIDAQGLVVTNNHVVENAEKITVKLSDEREFPAKLIGRDPKTDLAVIRIGDGKEKFPAAPLGDSSRLQVGEWIMAMGSPFGLANTVTAGIVSAKGRHIGAGPYDDFIQTDASINPGNSGGPLINLRGEVVGISTAIFSRTGGNLGIGFAIPINLAKEVLPELIKTGKVTRGWLGVSIQKVTPEIAEALGIEKGQGALIANVNEGSPADQAGIKVGDVIVEYDGKKIRDPNELPILVARTQVGKTVKATVLRERKLVPVTIKVGELKEEEVVASGPQTQKGKLGLAVQNVTPQIAESLGLDQAKGVVVSGVQPQSIAAEAGLRRGDVILQVNRKQIQNVGDYEKAVEETKPGANILFLVRRGGNNIFLALQAPDGRG